MPDAYRTLGFAVLLILSAGVFFNRAFDILAVLGHGRSEYRQRIDRIPERIGTVLVHVFGHKRMWLIPLSGLLHLFIFYGFVILFSFILKSVGQGVFGLEWDLPIIGGHPLLTLSQDLISVAVLVGLALALYQRLIERPERFHGSNETDAYVILTMIFLVVVTTLLTSAGEIALGYSQRQAWAAPVSVALAGALGGLPRATQQVIFEIAWWGHLLVVLSFLPYLLYSKHMHVLVGIPNVFLRNLEPAGALRPLNLDNAEAEYFGAREFSDLGWKHLLDGFACTECGRCHQACPAVMAGTPLSPKLLIMDLRDHLETTGMARVRGPAAAQPQLADVQEGRAARGEPLPLIHAEPQVGISPAALWSCTTCRACVYECPLMIEHVDTIVDGRRYLALTEGDVPGQLAQAFRQVERSGNPWGQSPASRLEWAQGLDVPLMAEKGRAEVLYWIGCAGAYDPASQKTARAVVRILQRAGIEFAVLGEEEWCHCEWGRRAGREDLYQAFAERNIATFGNYGVKTIITHCPHCFNTFQNEYPQFGGHYEVIHHSQYIARLVREKRITLGAVIGERVTYHDSCYLGRYNEVYDDPRSALQAVPGLELVEMERSRASGLCCGGGGAQVWFENEWQKKPVADIRLEEAMALQPREIATACPFCTIMLSSAAQSHGVTEQVRVRDVAEIVAQALG
jgi:Fe-S oxidoreductase